MNPPPSNPPPSSPPESCNRIAAALAGASRCLLLTHEHPDGDGIGSMLALRLALTALGKQVDCASPQGCPVRYRYLPGADQVRESCP